MGFEIGEYVRIVKDLSSYDEDLDLRGCFSQGEIVKIGGQNDSGEYRVIKFDGDDYCYLKEEDIEKIGELKEIEEDIMSYGVGDIISWKGKICKIIKKDSSDYTQTYKIEDYDGGNWIYNDDIKGRFNFLKIKFSETGKSYDYILDISKEKQKILQYFIETTRGIDLIEVTICDLNGDFVEARTIYPLTIMRTSNYENFNNFKIIIDIKIKNNIKEKTDMKNMFGNFYFGPYIKNDIKMSIKGLAYRNNNNDFVTLDEDGSLTNVNDMVFDFNVDKMLYVMPVALKDVKTGDIIFHQKNPMFVTMVNDGDLTVVDPCEGELKVIIPEKNIFNFNFVSKLVDFSKGLFNGATEEQPFGNMLPLMMLCNSDDSSMKDLIVPMMLMQNNGEADINKINPIMFMALMSNSSSTNDWIVPMMLMQNGGFNFGAVAE